MFWDYAPKIAQRLHASPHIVDAKYDPWLSAIGSAGQVEPALFPDQPYPFPKAGLQIRFNQEFRKARQRVEQGRPSLDDLALLARDAPDTTTHEGLHALYDLKDPVALDEFARMNKNHPPIGKNPRLDEMSVKMGYPPEQFSNQLLPALGDTAYLSHQQNANDQMRLKAQAYPAKERRVMEKIWELNQRKNPLEAIVEGMAKRVISRGRG
jgi:hypothetical protein